MLSPLQTFPAFIIMLNRSLYPLAFASPWPSHSKLRRHSLMPPHMVHAIGYVITYIHKTSPLWNPPAFKFSSQSKLVLSHKSLFKLEYWPHFIASFNLSAHCISEAGQACYVVSSSLDQLCNHCTGAAQDGAQIFNTRTRLSWALLLVLSFMEPYVPMEPYLCKILPPGFPIFALVCKDESNARCGKKSKQDPAQENTVLELQQGKNLNSSLNRPVQSRALEERKLCLTDAIICKWL